MKDRDINKLQSLQKLAASVEGNVTAISLLQEIEPLISEYFVAEVDLGAELIRIKLYNGQSFSLRVEEE